MVVGVAKSGSPAQQSPPARKPQQWQVAAERPAVKKDAGVRIGPMVAECLAGETARPEVGVSVPERQVWGQFQCRQNFVDMHCC